MKTIGVVGAGTMGRGIAQVAAQAELDVLLYDVVPGALTRALDSLRLVLKRLVEKGKLAQAAADATLARIQTTTTLQDFTPVDFVIEAAPEDLGMKKEIFAQLDRVCRPDVILATNTSSLSVTEIAAMTDRQDLVVGMHFFNPVPVMTLVEVVQGHRTSAQTAAMTTKVALLFGKTPVQVSDTPGFIVNRVARPFYAEALRLVSEGIATVPQVDACLRGIGFKIGPFELMDLIGIDVNYAVTQSVYRQYHQEPRFRPHSMQEKMVQAGLLGRKSGQGFYSYAENSPAPVQLQQAAVAKEGEPPDFAGRIALIVARNAADASSLLSAAAAAGVATELMTLTELPESALRGQEGDLQSHLTPLASRAWVCVDLTCLPRPEKRLLVKTLAHTLPADATLVTAVQATTVTDLASLSPYPERCVGLGGLPPYGDTTVELALPIQVADWRAGSRPVVSGAATAVSFFRLLGREPLVMSDGAGLAAARMLACLINEAVFAVMEGVASPVDIDTAMKLGTGYPEGPLAWANTLGWEWVLSVLENLHADLGDDRYRPAPLLRRLALAGRFG